MSTRSIRRTAALAATALAISAGFVGLGGSPASADDPVIVFYTQCDEMSTTATVKVKRINEDGTGATVIGDTGIAHCGVANGGATDTFLTGFAVNGAYGYFGWEKVDASALGVGRIRLDGTAAAERNFASVPAPAERLQMSPRSIGGYVFAYVDDGYLSQQAVSNPRVIKISTTDGTVSTAYQPTRRSQEIPVEYLSFGVGRDSLYVSTSEQQSQLLTKVSLDGTADLTYFNFADCVPDGITMEFLNGAGANLVAESDDTLFLYSRNVGGDHGISTVQTSSLTTTLQPFKAVPKNEGQPPAQFQVWGGNYLYYKNGTGKQISRTTKTGSVEDNIFPAIVKEGWVHHISPAKASTVTVTTTTSSSSTSSTAATTSSSSSTVSPTTTFPAPTVPKKGGLAGTVIARYLSMVIPKGAKVGLKVAPSSKKVCTVKSGKLLGLKSGNCRVTATVTPKSGKSTKKSTTLKV